MTTERWYFIRAYNTATIHAYGTEADCDRYVDHLNERLTVNLYGAYEADERETDVVVAVAIHAIADQRRSPEAIWEDPTPTEADHVTIAVEEYLMHGDYDQSDDGRYCWGQTYITLGEAQA